MDIYDVYYALGVSARLYEFNGCFRRIEHSAVRIVDRIVEEYNSNCRDGSLPKGRVIRVEDLVIRGGPPH